MIIGEIMISINIIMNINITSICISWGTISSVICIMTIVNIISPKVFLRVQDEHDAISMCIDFRFGRLYHTLINTETDMHIFSIFSRKYHINCQFCVYAFAPSRQVY